ncbi:MAG: N-acetyltransferase [Chloroflexi bacterium]|nr:MAG: N-acetyltransferase [Chloroflexota bacterium]
MAPSSLEVRPLRSRADEKQFATFPWQVYKDDPNWVPPLLSMQYEVFDPRKNPFWEHSRCERFIAWRDDRPVGTIAAIVNENHNRTHQDRVGFFGFFEVMPDEEAAHALFQAAGDWLHAQGMDTIRGPANPSVNDEYGMLVEGFDRPPVVMMTYNPPYYVEFTESFGFQKAMDLWAYYVDAGVYLKPDGTIRVPRKLQRVVDAVKRSGKFRIRKLEKRRWREEVERIKHIYNTAWEKNWGAVAMTDAEIEHLAKGLLQIIDPDLIFLVETPQGDPVGVSLTLPDVNQALHRAYPRPGVPELWTLLRFFWHYKVRPKVDGCRVLILGVLEPYRGRGVDALMYYETLQEALRKGYTWAEMSWILETNDMMNRAIRFLGGKVYKTYRIYEKPL